MICSPFDFVLHKLLLTIICCELAVYKHFIPSAYRNNSKLPIKKHPSFNLLDLHFPEAVFGSESWLNSGVSNNEMLPLNHDILC